MNKQKAPDGGPTSHETAARLVGDTSTHARGNAPPRFPVRYEDTKGRADGMPLPPAMAPEAHGGHYFTPEDRDKYDAVIGYDKGMAPGYDPVKESVSGAEDERGKYEVKPWQSPSGEDGTCLTKVNRDGSRSILAILAVDPMGNAVQLPPNTVALKAGWKFAATSDLSTKTKAAEEFNRKDEENRKSAENAKPVAPPVVPVIQSQESPEARKAREEADPVAEALRHGQSKSNAEKADELTKDAKDKK